MMHGQLKHHIEKLIPLADDEFAFIRSHFISQNFKKGDFLIQQGENVLYLYYVVSGLLKLVYNDESGKEYIVSFSMEDWWESDIHAYYRQTKATMSLQCIEDTDVLCITLEGYKELCAGLQKMEHFFLEKSIGGHIASQQRILSFITSNATERYEQLLKRYPQLIQRVPKSLLASYLGVSRETLSRLSS
ncbi:Crp/Fnr family transcriptional regulator [Ohtaekwangia kribbensis]|uniref:Crp/Fnr family transcriptional regulator n=1 Tax=Ohtaekwangia kribbensis TaxID=688913 RepID=A0ABW3K1W6_9BACT